MAPGHDSMPGLPPGYFGQKRKSARLTGLQMQVRWLQFFYPRFWHQSINGVKTLHRCFVLHTGEGQFALPSSMVWPLCGHHLSMDRPDGGNSWRASCGRRHWGNRNRPQVAFPKRQKTKRWILQALDGHSSRTISWVVASGDGARMKRLDRKLEELSKCLF